jgi:hypothetical protein
MPKEAARCLYPPTDLEILIVRHRIWLQRIRDRLRMRGEKPSHWNWFVSAEGTPFSCLQSIAT